MNEDFGFFRAALIVLGSWLFVALAAWIAERLV